MWCILAATLSLDDFNLQIWCMKSNHWVFLMNIVDFVASFLYSDWPILYCKFHGYIQTNSMHVVLHSPHQSWFLMYVHLLIMYVDAATVM